MRYLGGHIGSVVSALVDGHLDAASAERAWSHALSCAGCRHRIEREGWVKTRLATMSGSEPPPELLSSLYTLKSSDRQAAAEAWAAVDVVERRGHSRRRAGLALAGAGSVSAAVLGLAYLTGAAGGYSGGSTPAANLTGPPRPAVTVSTPTAEAPRPGSRTGQPPLR